jgi:hypothetical protein
MDIIQDVPMAISYLEEGFCLWVGAGLTIQLTDDPTLTPNWEKLTSALEKEAEIDTGGGVDFPTRLQQCAGVLGNKFFYDRLRGLYYSDLCYRILEIALDSVKRSATGGIVPVGIRRIACLGQLANPIVNFNIEPLSSIALARPSGPMRLLSHASRGASLTVGRHAPHSGFRRIAYHPHGLVSDGGGCVMTAREYAEKRMTLAFQLAVTSAFGQDLAIVGLGLSEQETHDQIREYRRDLRRIYWFSTKEFAEKQAEFCRKADIDIVLLDSWRAFWETWDIIQVDISEPQLHQAWHTIVVEAAAECGGGRADSLADDLEKHEVTRELAAKLRAASKALGERGDVREVGGLAPAEVVRMVTDAMRARNYEVHQDPVSFAPPLPLGTD